MIQKSVFNSLRTVLAQSSLIKKSNKRFFSSTQNTTIEHIRNHNLKFDTNYWILQVYPFYPQIFRKKEKNMYQIPDYSTVLSLVFIDKNVEDDVAWQNRKSISLKFKDVGMILNTQIKSGKQVIIQTNQNYKINSSRSKILKLKDLIQQQKISIHLNSKSEGNRTSSIFQLQGSQDDWQIQAKMPYNQYRILYKVIQNSLLDLSGWKFMMELQKRQQLSKMQGKIVDDKEIAELLKN